MDNYERVEGPKAGDQESASSQMRDSTEPQSQSQVQWEDLAD
jgi:hypothetical protein